jgi:pimeloyl-[acyl-carrier protein] methyl ester esterase
MHIKKIGQGKDLVLIHGWGMHSGIWEPIIKKFSNQYTLHLVDIPGMGKSDSIDPYDLNNLAEAISQKLPSSFDILGWSLGSLIALKMSLLHPQKIHRMVLVGGRLVLLTRQIGVVALMLEILMILLISFLKITNQL